MIRKSELRSTVEEVLGEELDGTLSPKATGELAGSVVDRIALEHEILDDEDADLRDLDDLEEDESDI